MIAESGESNPVSCELSAKEPCKEEESSSLALCETESNSSAESEVSSTAFVVVDTPSSQRKTVTFQNVEIQEYDMILGDHPSTTLGPSVTIEWKPVRSHVLTVDDYESAFDDNSRRRGQELRMPQSVRKGLLRRFHSEEEMKRSRSEVRKIQSQRNMTRAMEELETVSSLIESAGRKYKKWMRRRRGVEPEPAEAWVQQYKQQYKEGKKDAPYAGRRAVSWHASDAHELEETLNDPPLRKSTSSVGDLSALS